MNPDLREALLYHNQSPQMARMIAEFDQAKATVMEAASKLTLAELVLFIEQAHAHHGPEDSIASAFTVIGANTVLDELVQIANQEDAD